MISLRANILANFAGSIWAALMNVLFVPVYIRFLGIETYGLIGVFTALQSWLVLLDMGLMQTISREMARFVGGNYQGLNIHRLLRSVEVVYVALAMFFSLAWYGLCPWIGREWLNRGTLAEEDVVMALKIMGLVVSLRWISGLYRVSVLGLQRQVSLNLALIVFSTLRGAGVLGVLAFVECSIYAFFIYQGFVAFLEAFALRFLVYSYLPKTKEWVGFDFLELKRVWRFASGVFLISLLSLLLTQVDKLILSKMLLLSDFGYYTLAGLIASSLYQLITPVSNAVYPKMVEYLSRNDSNRIASVYHRYSMFMSLATIPAAVVMALFSEHLLLLWTKDQQTAQIAAPVLSVLVLGTMFNGLMHMPYLMQLASGWTELTVKINIVAVIVLVPSLVLVSPGYGMMGAATVWCLLNLGYVLIAVPLMHRRLLINEMRSWYLKDVTPIGLISIFVAGSVAIFTPKPSVHSVSEGFFWILMASVLSFGLSFLYVRKNGSPVNQN